MRITAVANMDPAATVSFPMCTYTVEMNKS